MAVLKVVELLSNSKESWEDAAQNAVTKASKSLKGIRSLNVTNMSCVVEDGKITEYRLNSKVTFAIKD